MREDFFFISYSSVDGKEFAIKLADELFAGPPAIPVWLDKRALRPGEDWDEQIPDRIKTCKGMLFVMSADSVRPNSECKNEWRLALKCKKPVIPLLLGRDTELPFGLGSREWINFTGSFDSALARLRKHLAWMDSQEGQLQLLKHRLTDAERELRRADPGQDARIKADITELEQEIAHQQAIIDDPKAAAQQVQQSIETGLEGERQRAKPVGGSTQGKYINRPPAVAPSWFQDRYVETALIGDFLKDDGLRLMIVVGRAGIGKTAMVCRLLKSIESGSLPDEDGSLSADGIVYLSATGSHRVNLPHLYADLCRLLSESSAHLLDAVYKNAQASTESKMQALLEAFPSGRTIVLLDNFEDVVDSQTGEIRDVELDEALRALLNLSHHGVKVILTTQVAPRSLQLLQPGRQRTIELDKGLDHPYAENVLRAMDKDGKLGLRDGPDELLAAARERTRGYPRALEALVAILNADRDATLQELLSDAQRLLPENVVQKLVGEAFSRLDSMAQRVMQALAVYAYPVPPAAVDYLLQPHLPGVDSAPVLRRLVNMHFVRREAGNYYLHQEDRAYALGRVPEGMSEDWRVAEKSLYTRPSLQHRAAGYFRKVRREGSTWASLEDLSPLVAEFDLLSASGDYEIALEVLDTILPVLERQGQYRQIVRLADRLCRQAKQPFRSIALGLAGEAHSELGELQQAIGHLKAALEGPISEVQPGRVISWRLCLAGCYALSGDNTSANTEYRHVLENAQDDVRTQVAALLGLGSAAEALDSHAEAESSYERALHVLAPQLMIQVEEDDKIVLSPSVLPPGVILENPWAWHPIAPLAPATSSEPFEVSYLFGIETAGVDVGASSPEGDSVSLDKVSTRGEETETSVELIPLLVTRDLAEIWMSFARLRARTDRLSEAVACCRLALEMYGALEIELGITRALDLFRRLVGQVSDAEAEAILAAQEEQLKRARASGYRRLEIAILNDLAEHYLDRGKTDSAEALNFELSRHAAELEDPSLWIRAEIGLARIEWARGKPDVAVEKLETLLKGGPHDLHLETDILSMLGRVELTRGRRPAASRYLLAASRGYAATGSLWQHIEAERLLASIAIDERDYDEAVRRLKSALQLVRSAGIRSLNTSVLCDLANAYLKAGAPEQAQVTVDEAASIASEIELPSTAAEARMTIGQIASELGKFERAEAAYQQAKDAFQSVGNQYGQISAMYGLAGLYHRSEQRDAAVSAARLAWQMASELGDPAEMRVARWELASALSDRGLHAEAIQHMEAVVAETPFDAAAICNLGHVLHEAGEYDRSLEESRRSLAIDPAQFVAIRNLGHAYLAKGLVDDAEREYRRAIKDRKGGENFIETIRTIKRMISHQPNLPKGRELLELFEEEQRKLEAEERSAVAAGPSRV